MENDKETVSAEEFAGLAPSPGTMLEMKLGGMRESATRAANRGKPVVDPSTLFVISFKNAIRGVHWNYAKATLDLMRKVCPSDSQWALVRTDLLDIINSEDRALVNLCAAVLSPEDLDGMIEAIKEETRKQHGTGRTTDSVAGGNRSGSGGAEADSTGAVGDGDRDEFVYEPGDARFTDEQLADLQRGV